MPEPTLYGFELEAQSFYLFDTENKVQDDGTELSEWARNLGEKIRINSGQVETVWQSF
jgi:hypothetical protein